jgi:hypothetical protein
MPESRNLALRRMYNISARTMHYERVEREMQRKDEASRFLGPHCGLGESLEGGRLRPRRVLQFGWR